MIYLISCLFTIFFVYYSKYQFVDGRKGKWHSFGFLMRICLVTAFFINPSWKDVFLATTISILIYDIGLNVIALNQKWNYIGTTSWIDRKLGKKRYYLYILLLVISIFTKCY